MAMIFRPTSAAAASMRPFAAKLASSLPGSRGVKNQIMDGFILRAVGDGKNVTVYVVEAPAVLGLYVGGGTTESIYPGVINLFDSMLDAAVRLPVGTGDLCYPAADFAPILIEPGYQQTSGAAVSKRSGTQNGIVTIDGRSVVYGNWDDVNYATSPALIYRAFPTPNALLSVAVKYKDQTLNNPFRQPAIGISRLYAAGGDPGSDAYGPATDASRDYFEIDVYGLGIEAQNAAKVIGALEWGEHDGLVLVDFGARQHLIRYSMTVDADGGVPVGHVVWRNQLDSYRNLSGPFSAGAGDPVGEKSSVFFAERTEQSGVVVTLISSLFKVSAGGVVSEVELNRYVYTEDSSAPPTGEQQSNIHASAVEAAGGMRYLAINYNGYDQLSSIPSITPFFRLFAYDDAGVKTDIPIPGMLPVNHWLGLYAPNSGGFIANANRQRDTICQYAPGYAAVLVMPSLDHNPDTAEAIDLHMAVINMATGAVVGVSPALTAHSIMDGLSLSAVEQGVVVDGAITRHAKLLLSKVKAAGQIRPFFKPLCPSDIFMVHGLSGATKIATCSHPAHAYYLGTALKPAKVGQTTGIRGLLRP